MHALFQFITSCIVSSAVWSLCVLVSTSVIVEIQSHLFHFSLLYSCHHIQHSSMGEQVWGCPTSMDHGTERDLVPSKDCLWFNTASVQTSMLLFKWALLTVFHLYLTVILIYKTSFLKPLSGLLRKVTVAWKKIGQNVLENCNVSFHSLIA